MSDLAKFSEVKNERNIWEGTASACRAARHGTDSACRARYGICNDVFSSCAVHMVYLQTHLIGQFFEVVFTHKRPSWLFIHETEWQSGGGGAQLPLLARILLVNEWPIL